MSMLFRQLFDPISSTYTYLLGDSTRGEAVLIDPVFEHVRRDSALMDELGLRLVATLETHAHADHVTGAWLLKQKWGSRIAIADAAGAQNADQHLKHGDRIMFGHRHLRVLATPGHTSGCLTYVLDDESVAFTGDALLIRGCGRTDFQQGSPETLYRSIHEQIFSLPDECLLYPGHDYRGLTVTSVREERLHNPRLGGSASEADFAGFMRHLGLPHPKLIDIAVPANLKCGRPEAAAGALNDPMWAPLRFTFAGIWEIEPWALVERLSDIQVIDVRESTEFNDALGHIPGAKLIPLSVLKDRHADIDPSRPIVTVCRAGARSAQASVLLAKAGFPIVANLAGGMLRWRVERMPVEGESS